MTKRNLFSLASVASLLLVLIAPFSLVATAQSVKLEVLSKDAAVTRSPCRLPLHPRSWSCSTTTLRSPRHKELSARRTCPWPP